MKTYQIKIQICDDYIETIKLYCEELARIKSEFVWLDGSKLETKGLLATEQAWLDLLYKWKESPYEEVTTFEDYLALVTKIGEFAQTEFSVFTIEQLIRIGF